METKDNTTLPLWATLLHEYYGNYFTKQRADFWMAELRQPADAGTGSYTTDEEVIDAIRFVREKQSRTPDADSKKRKEITLDELIIWIRWRRKEMRRDSLSPDDAANCALCMHGWITVWLSLPENPTSVDFTPRSREYVVPCMCNQGRTRVLQTAKDYQGIGQSQVDRLNALAQQGAKQVAMRNRIMAEEVKALEEATQNAAAHAGEDEEWFPAEEAAPEGVPF
jgi:hypothetical protein